MIEPSARTKAMKISPRLLTVTGLAMAVSVLGSMQSHAAAPLPVAKTVDLQSNVVMVRDGFRRYGGNRGYRHRGGGYRYGGYRGYRHYGGGYNNYWAAPAGAFIAGALLGGAIANGGYYGGGYYGGGYYPSGNYAGDAYVGRVYSAPRPYYRQGYVDGYRAGYNGRPYGGQLFCTPRQADAGSC
jgi:hypothetical protein